MGCTVLVLTILLLLICGTLVATRRLRSAALLSLLPLAMLTSATAPATQWMLDRAHMPASPEPSDDLQDTVIVLLAGGVDNDEHGVRPGLAGYSRLLTTAQQSLLCQQQRRTCTVIVSGGAPRAGQSSEAGVYARELAALGVPMDHILLEGASANTWQNARNTSAILRAGVSRVVLVTSGLHLKRSLLYFRHFGVIAEGVSSDQLRAAPGWLPSALNLLLVEVMLHERIGVLRYHVYNTLGWNEPPIPPAGLTPGTTTHASPR